MPRTENLDEVRAVLETDREWAAFALADLSPEHAAYSEWHLADDRSAVTLVYRDFSPPLFFALGTPENVAPLLEEIAEEHELYVSVREGVPERLAAAGYRHDLKPMYRMVLNADAFPESADCRAERLGPADYKQIADLFADGEGNGERPGFFKQASLANGVYFGIRERGVLVAAAGTHMFAPEQSVGCLGNVYTRRDRRGRGLALATTAAVTAELLRHGIRTIVLNVSSDNAAAIRIYKQLGFSRYCDYWEGKACSIGTR